MLKKIILTGAIIITMINADNIDKGIQNNDGSQKELKTKTDLERMRADLARGAQLGDAESTFFLGYTYLNDMTFKDGSRVEKDTEKAKKLLEKAIKLGSNKAAAALINNNFKEKNIKELADTVKKIQEASLIQNEDKDYYSMFLGSYILDTNSTDANAIETAMKWMYEAEKKRNNPKMQFIMAFVYQKLGNEAAANLYLNKSCTNDSMKSQCANFKIGATNNEQTCNK